MPAPILTTLRPRVRIGETILMGPGKMGLLSAVIEHGSISAAARAEGMSFRRAWTLIEEMNKAAGRPVVVASAGGKGGGGATVTPLGRGMVEQYAAIEAACAQAAAPHLRKLAQLLKQSTQ